MSLTFYERVGHEGRCPSPFSWRIRYALAHKGVPFEVRPVRFADVETIRNLSGQHLTPILKHGDDVVHERGISPATLRSSFLTGHLYSVVKLGERWRISSTLGRKRNSGHRCGASFMPTFLPYLIRRPRLFPGSRERALGMSLEDACVIRKASYGISRSMRATCASADSAALHLRRGTGVWRLHCIFPVPDGAAGESKGSHCRRVTYRYLAHAHDCAVR